MPRSVSAEFTSVLAASMFLFGGLFGALSTGMGSSYDTKCSELLESRTINYNGSIDEYSGMFEPDLFAASDSGKGGVLLMSSDRLAVENGSRLEFSFKERIWLECEAGKIQVSTHFLDEKIEDSNTKTGDNSD